MPVMARLGTLHITEPKSDMYPSWAVLPLKRETCVKMTISLSSLQSESIKKLDSLRNFKSSLVNTALLWMHKVLKIHRLFSRLFGVWLLQLKKASRGWREMAHGLRSLAVLEDPCSILSTHIAAPNYLWLQFLGLWRFLTSINTRHAHSSQTYMEGKRPIQLKKNIFKKKEMANKYIVSTLWRFKLKCVTRFFNHRKVGGSRQPLGWDEVKSCLKCELGTPAPLCSQKTCINVFTYVSEDTANDFCSTVMNQFIRMTCIAKLVKWDHANSCFLEAYIKRFWCHDFT